MFDLAAQTLQGDAVIAKSPNGADVGAHAAAGDDIDFDAVLLQNLNDPNVGQSAGPSGGERQADAAVSHLTGQPADIGIEIAVGPPAQALRGRGGRTSVDEAVHFLPHLLEEFVELFFAFLTADDRPQFGLLLWGTLANLAQEQVTIV